MEIRLGSRFEGRVDSLGGRVLDRVEEIIRESKTHLLRAFYSFTEGNDQRLKGLESAGSALSGRIASLETRVLELDASQRAARRLVSRTA